MLDFVHTRVSPLFAILATVPTVALALTPPHVHNASCHYLPEDADWPSWDQWQSLNQTVGGRLIAGSPLASVCYGERANDAACAVLRANWTEEHTYFADPVAIMSPKFLNDSCTPFVATDTPGHHPSSSCTLGNIPSYAINVSSAEDVIAGVRFAKKRNIRLVVKNTGHDYQGRSCGRGALSLWMHNLQDIAFLNYTSKSYTGPAVRLGAGVQAYAANAAVASHGLRVTGGLCPTVGLAGGYVTGGGHGPLMGLYGLAADNSLEFEVVTPDMGYMVASPNQNSDLFWALNGGGGSAYAVILSQTTRAHAEGPVAAATLTFNKTDDATYWEAINAWHVLVPSLNRVPGAACTFSIAQQSTEAFITVLDGNTAEVNKTLAPFLSRLDRLNVPYTNVITQAPTYYEHYTTVTSNLNFPTNNLAGGRLIPLSAVEETARRTDLVAAIRAIVGSNTSKFTVSGNAADLSVSRTGLDNAVLPAWRAMAYSLIISAYPDPAASVSVLDRVNAEIIAGQDILRDLTPGSGTYINEATVEPAYWKEEYYGPNYEKLLAVKKRYDSGVVLYGPGVVGSDYWTVASDGRLCQAEHANAG